MNIFIALVLDYFKLRNTKNRIERVNGVKTCGWRLMGSTVQEDSNVIQNIQCSTSAAAGPVTAGPDITTVSGDSTGVTMTDGESPVDDSGIMVTTGAPTEVTETMIGDDGPDAVNFPAVLTTVGTDSSDSTSSDDVTSASEIASTISVPGVFTLVDTLPTTDPTATDTTPVDTTLPATDGMAMPAETTPAETTPAASTPAPTTPAVTTPVATTLALSEQQRAACLVAIEADGNENIIFTRKNFYFSTKRGNLR